MTTCRKCSNEIPSSYIKDGVLRRTYWKRGYCFGCSPLDSRNNKQLEKVRTDGLKQCAGRCKRELPLKDFHRKSGVCRLCLAEESRRINQETKRKAVAYLGGACSKCGYSKCLAALEFHHRNPAEKDFEIGAKRRSNFESLVPELNKCDLVCRNCHAEAHHFTS